MHLCISPCGLKFAEQHPNTVNFWYVSIQNNNNWCQIFYWFQPVLYIHTSPWSFALLFCAAILRQRWVYSVKIMPNLHRKQAMIFDWITALSSTFVLLPFCSRLHNYIFILQVWMILIYGWSIHIFFLVVLLHFSNIHPSIHPWWKSLFFSPNNLKNNESLYGVSFWNWADVTCCSLS